MLFFFASSECSTKTLTGPSPRPSSAISWPPWVKRWRKWTWRTSSLHSRTNMATSTTKTLSNTSSKARTNDVFAPRFPSMELSFADVYFEASHSFYLVIKLFFPGGTGKTCSSNHHRQWIGALFQMLSLVFRGFMGTSMEWFLGTTRWGRDRRSWRKLSQRVHFFYLFEIY